MLRRINERSKQKRIISQLPDINTASIFVLKYFPIGSVVGAEAAISPGSAAASGVSPSKSTSVLTLSFRRKVSADP
jgi:hypothetical protein